MTAESALGELLSDAALDGPHAFIITTDPAVRARFWPFEQREFAGADCAIVPVDAGKLIARASA